ncbi:MAG: alpha-glucosidase [Pseudomonadota bacterium]|jgi:alpha-glucosidase
MERSPGRQAPGKQSQGRRPAENQDTGGPGSGGRLPSAARSWLEGAVLYQIYPLSFRDGNGDGWGDLWGVAEGLDHVAALGVDAIWLSPFYTSPLADFGYDVADHTAVDPRLGDMATLERVLTKAHRLGLRVMLDLVLGHTSIRHAWFEESRRSRDNARADWYVWADPAADGGPPNNWLSVFGGPAWTWEPRRRQYYLHHFLPQQPALNYRSPGALATMMDVARFWLDKGVDGFRVDAVDFLARDPDLRPNPPVAPHPVEIPAKPFGMQVHVRDMMHDDIRGVLAALRRVADDYPGTVLLGELSSQKGAAERIARYTAPGGLHAAYTLDLPKRPFSAAAFRTTLMAAAERGGTCWSLSNHDVERAASRWRPEGADPARFEALLALLLACLPGTVCVYQGDELGLPQADLTYEDLRDPFGLNFWPDFKGRDGSRTPLPWTPQAPNGGFCPSEVRPWLPVAGPHLSRAVAVQDRRTGSTLSLWKAALALRRDTPALSRGGLSHVDEEGSVLAFQRTEAGHTEAGPTERTGTEGERRIACVFNLSNAPARYTLPGGDGEREAGGGNAWTPLRIPRPSGAPVPTYTNGTITLPPLGVWLGATGG